MAPQNPSPENDQPSSGIHAGRDIKAGRDIAGGNIAGRDMAGGDILSNSAAVNFREELAHWRKEMETRIQASPGLSPDEKTDLKDQVGKIEGEAAKGSQADTGRLEKLVNTLAVMAPDIFDVVVATLANPLAGVGLVLKKIGDKARLERERGSAST